ncbi:cell division protein CrgA [Demetria terragena]|uniref:cell division protein CrgA n=1 Tax=Demetria terragena TaxID=63959 RepID=UPI000364D087|nr:cell division protein CrgA [Demetria terragena]
MSTSKDKDTPDSTDKSAKDDTATSKTSKLKKRRGTRPQAVPGLNPSWWAPVMCTLMLVGLLWIVVFYVASDGTKNTWPIPGIGYGNLAIGFGLIMAGFLMTTRWK